MSLPRQYCRGKLKMPYAVCLPRDTLTANDWQIRGKFVSNSPVKKQNKKYLKYYQKN
jgi:hypothetical protein